MNYQYALFIVLSIFVVQSNMGMQGVLIPSNSFYEGECPVCRENLGSCYRILPCDRNTHYFHEDCMKLGRKAQSWLRGQSFDIDDPTEDPFVCPCCVSGLEERTACCDSVEEMDNELEAFTMSQA